MQIRRRRMPRLADPGARRGPESAMPAPGRASIPRRLLRPLLAATLALPLAVPAQEARPIPEVDVVGTAPLPGLPTPIAQIPANVQTFGAWIGVQYRLDRTGRSR
jgi:hypothetical protein